MANPRKFSEKIALHTHRQAEETARFEQIMKEVSDATARVHPDRGSNKNALRVNSSQALGSFRGGSLPNVSAGTPTVKTTSHITDSKPEDPIQMKIQYNREGRSSRPQGGPMRRPPDRKHDTSPYSISPFLSPPSDTGWRRTNSDSALHQSAMQGGMGGERKENSSSRWMLQTLNGPEQHDGRPRSCEVPRVPGINIYPSAHEPGTVQIPIGNNTGSLPDLTSVHFPSPIHTPLDQDQDQGSSPYSSSPVNTSPSSTLSPTSVPAGVRQQQGRFPFSGPPISHHQNHLSVPVNSRYLHHNKGVALENNLITLLEKTDYTQLSGMGSIYQQIPPQSPSPTLQQPGYRSPRPSPQSSPGVGHHSAPCSPGAPSPLSNDYLLNQHQANQLQQHFEQFSMGVDWAQLVASLVESGCTWTAQVQVDQPLSPVSNMSYVDQPGTIHLTQTQSQTLSDITGVGTAELSGDAGYYSTSPSQMVYPTAPASLHTTPNTPTSIPDIILTDFSTADDITRQELTLSKQLEAELLSEESLREGLGPIDLDGLQMLSDPTINLISDGVEDNFRLDRS
ncbi:CREB-regulated transcription coactivator 1 isoform X2 [Photinus pyralis]|uniref:CREB-regulated transcription coactivator 1 isoform X2 n=1 Tax=Photinus pyralis TaxID=7054 RepID=UPI0012671072|nr:CREB-regulated transcription coactivator 1 isoform X2 [Photinus pyralis]